MGIRRKFAVDQKKIVEGVWFDLGDGLKVRVASIKSPKYEDALERLLKPHRAQLRTKSLPEEVKDAAVIEAMAEGLLLDWEGDEKPYSKEAAIEYLSDPETSEFRDTIVVLARDIDQFRLEYEAAAEKNLPTA